MKIGERIKARRLELDIDVNKIAKKLGKNRATIYRYENGGIENLPTSIMEPLAEILQTTPVNLMGWADEDVLLAKSMVPQPGPPDSEHYVKKFVVKDSSQEVIINALQALAFYSGREVNDLFDPNDNEIVVNGIKIPFPVDFSFSEESIENDSNHPFVSKTEQEHLRKYRSIDNKGKHTVDTVLEMEYNRCDNPHLLLNAAHAIDGVTVENKQHGEDIMDDENC